MRHVLQPPHFRRLPTELTPGCQHLCWEPKSNHSLQMSHQSHHLLLRGAGPLSLTPWLRSCRCSPASRQPSSSQVSSARSGSTSLSSPSLPSSFAGRQDPAHPTARGYSGPGFDTLPGLNFHLGLPADQSAEVPLSSSPALWHQQLPEGLFSST